MNKLGIRSNAFIISILLMMLCVQSFSMHFHVEHHDADDHHAHMSAHSHLTDEAADHHAGIDHDEEVGATLQSTLVKKMISYDALLFLLLAFVLLPPARPCFWRPLHLLFEWRTLLFFRPLLRAPPL